MLQNRKPRIQSLQWSKENYAQAVARIRKNQQITWQRRSACQRGKGHNAFLSYVNIVSRSIGKSQHAEHMMVQQNIQAARHKTISLPAKKTRRILYRVTPALKKEP